MDFFFKWNFGRMNKVFFLNYNNKTVSEGQHQKEASSIRDTICGTNDSWEYKKKYTNLFSNEEHITISLKS
jgi:hypothetical protein